MVGPLSDRLNFSGGENIPAVPTLISSDSHLLEPEDLWVGRIERRFAARAPRLVRGTRGDQWIADGAYQLGNLGPATAAGVRFDTPERLQLTGRIDEAAPGAFDPEARLREIDRDGVAVEMLYPTVTLHAYRIPDPALLTAVLCASNHWLAEFCANNPARFKGIALINLDNVAEAVKQLDRSAKAGFVGAAIPVDPGRFDYGDPRYEPFWHAAADLALPLSLHVGTQRWVPGLKPQTQSRQDPLVLINRDAEVRRSLAKMILAGVFKRSPGLRVVTLEYEASWAPYFLFRLDDFYTHRPLGRASPRLRNGALPSDVFRAHVSVSFQEDEAGLRHLDTLGEDNLMWGSDYPHAESTFPRSREILERLLKDATPEQRTAIAGGNAARLYRLPIEEIAGRRDRMAGYFFDGPCEPQVTQRRVAQRCLSRARFSQFSGR